MILEQYSKKAILAEIKMELELAENYLQALSYKILSWKEDYFNHKIGKRYLAKDKLALLVDENLADKIALNLLFTTLMMGKNSIQSYIGHLASQIHLDIDSYDIIKLCAWIVGYCDNTIYTIIKPSIASYQTYTIEPTISLSDENLSKLSRTFFLPPSTKPLLDWTNPYNGGYDFAKDNAILGDKFNTHSFPLRLDTLNILQNVKYKLTDVINTPELPKEDFNEEALTAFKLSQIQARKIYKEYKDKEFSFVWQFDKRGRIYSKGYDINVQGNSYRKASLEFAKKEKITPEGLKWLKIDIANHYGLDKETFDDRLKWFDENEQILESLSYQAEDSLAYEQGVKAYRQTQLGKAIGYIVRLDATASGPQILSVLARDKIGMKNLNVLGEQRNDLYTLVTKKVYERTKDSPLWKDFNGDFKAIRKLVKKAIMVSYYNSTAKPAEIFGKDTKELQTFYEVLKEVTPGAIKIQQLINAAWDNKRAVNKWTLPDGHTSYCPITRILESRLEIPEIQAKIVYTHKVNQPNPAENKSLAPNVTHSIDAWICRHIILALSEKGIDISPIHDSFGVHPNHCDLLRKIYVGALARLYRENILENILEQITQAKVVLALNPYEEEINKEIISNHYGHYIC